jgi:hypothetical protein
MYNLLWLVTLQNQGTHYEAWNVGVLGPVTLSGLNEGKRDLSNQKWTYQVPAAHLLCYSSLNLDRHTHTD